MSAEPVKLFLNPTAGRGRAGKRESRISELLSHCGAAVETCLSSGVGDLEEDGALERIIPSALSTVDSLLDATEQDHRTVYMIMSPLSEEPHLRLLYEGILGAVQSEFEMSEPVPVRAPLELRRIESRRP